MIGLAFAIAAAACSQPGGPAPSAPGAVGKTLYETHCALCHSIDGSAKTGPTFKNIYGTTVKISGAGGVGGSTTATFDDDYIRESTWFPTRKVTAGYEGVAMPSFGGVLDDAKLNALIAFLKSEWSTDEWRRHGGLSKEGKTAAEADAARPAVTPPTPAPPAPVVPPAAPFDRFLTRLSALTPAAPEAYFLLGEEVADAVDSPERAKLAKELFTLAFAMDVERTGGKGGELAASCCLALAAVTRSETDRRWLGAMAVAIDPRRRPPGWLAGQQEAVGAQTAYMAASALGCVRSGDGRQALLYLDDAGVRALLGKYDRLIIDSPYKGTLAATELEAGRWPCKECQNQRIVKKPGKGGEYRLCPTCNGRPGMKLTPEQWLAQIRLESLLLSGIHRSWGAQVASDLGQPLRDPDVRDLPGVLGVDASKRVWKNGAWAAP